jgi:hypothetical protein
MAVALDAAYAGEMESGAVAQERPQRVISGMRPLSFGATSLGGQRVFVNDMVEDGPVYLVFLNHGDMVSDDFARQLHRITDGYGERGRTHWYGVMTTDQTRALSWRAEHGPVFPLLIDQDLTLAQLYDVRTAPTIVKIDEDGFAVARWEGFSATNLIGLNREFARFIDRDAQDLDFAMAPNVTMFGSPLRRHW